MPAVNANNSKNDSENGRNRERPDTWNGLNTLKKERLHKSFQ